MIMEDYIPELDRERFIADTLYKKLWNHDYTPCPYSLDMAFIVLFLSFYRFVITSLKKYRYYFLRRFFICLAEAIKRD